MRCQVYRPLYHLTAEIGVTTSEVAIELPDPSITSVFLDLVEIDDESPRPALTNGSSKSRRLGRRGGYSSDEDDFLPEVKINGIHRGSEDLLLRKMEIVTQHLQSLADESTIFIRPANGSDSGNKEDENWTLNLLDLQQFVRQSELERVVERKYGSDALRLVRIIVEKHHVDQDQVISFPCHFNKSLKN
jgi:hypothetical protein